MAKLQDLILSDLDYDEVGADPQEFIRRLLHLLAGEVKSEVFDLFLEVAHAWDEQTDIYSVDKFIDEYFAHKCPKCGHNLEMEVK